ncbi:DUF3520 domain-containing protein [Prolixibacteraceae bacterium JC049]|nr:DUF3520 domain-containing protein [Prolixibacteraceae bacterium JC049]
MNTKAVIISLIILLIGLQSWGMRVCGIITDESGAPLPGTSVYIKSTVKGTISDMNGYYELMVKKGDILVFSFVGMIKQEIAVKDQWKINVTMKADNAGLDEVVVVAFGKQRKEVLTGAMCKARPMFSNVGYSYGMQPCAPAIQNKRGSEDYAIIRENEYKMVHQSPVSTFSVDVDAAAYSNVRRFIMSGQKPPQDAVRIEEMINYFSYDYKMPQNKHPFSINHELAACPWNKDNLLLHVGLQAKKIATENLPASNLVFLLDVSGSMSNANKLPLLKRAFKLLVNQLREEDRVAIVVYAGSSGLVLPSTSGKEKKKILDALNRLQAGGSTAGGAGLKLAYKTAREQFIDGGNNRILLATDGDFNVGASSNSEMERMIEKERESGIFISVLGFGMGNYKDSKMEVIADKGNGNYAYIDNLLEAKKVLVNEFGGTLFTIAKDVKIQIEFNPAVVAEYRLIGYENRILNREDFDNDKKDAGELGSGHTVTALYEIRLTKNESMSPSGLRYQHTKTSKKADLKNEIAYIKFRYKKPEGKKSILIKEIIPNTSIDNNELSDNYNFSAAVAGFGMLLRDSEYKGKCNFDMIIDMAKNAKGEDEEGYRSEFIRLAKLTKELYSSVKID